MSAIPDPMQELERKTLEQLQHIVHSHKVKRIPTGVALEASRALWAVCSGLVPRATMDFVAEAINEFSDALRYEPESKDVYVMDGCKVVVVQRFGNTVTKTTISVAEDLDWNVKEGAVTFDPQQYVTPEESAHKLVLKLREEFTAKAKTSL